jgi:hypothetical protein
MKEENLQIEDHSGDRKYFTMVPNYILNHSTANDQSLYLHMKRAAGDNGLCYMSKRSLAKKMGIGIYALNTSIKYLISHKWIAEIGKKPIKTTSGEQFITVYKINDIWGLNNAFYSQGASELAYPKVRLNSQGGASELAPKKNNTKEDNTSELKIPNNNPISSLSEKPYDSMADLAADGCLVDPKDNPKNIPFNFTGYMNTLKNSTKESWKILHLYWSYKKINLTTLKQARLQYAMDIKYAEGLAGFPREKIVEAFKVAKEDAEKNMYDWKLSTVFKKITTIHD